jgi:alkylation response protein AidB-like acyl-CoA dehydrogenase
MADLWIRVELMRTAARNAAVSCAGSEGLLNASLAQSFCSDAAVEIAEETIQLHAGIAMTWEHPAHLYLKRAKASQVALGRASIHRKLLGECIGLVEY